MKKPIKFYKEYYSEHLRQTLYLFIGHTIPEVQAKLRKELGGGVTLNEDEYAFLEGCSLEVESGHLVRQIVWMRYPRYLTLMHELLHMSIKMLRYAGINDFNHKDTEEILCQTQEYWVKRIWNDIEPLAQKFRKSQR